MDILPRVSTSHKISYSPRYRLIYEDVIASLHPPCRRPSHKIAKGSFESNRLSLLADSTISQYSTHVIPCSIAALIVAFPSLQDLRQHIHDKIYSNESMFATDDDYLKNIVNMMNFPQQRRERQMNFTYLLDRNAVGVDEAEMKVYPRTIEFRQARGTLDGEEIDRWIEFCLGLVVFAKTLAEDPRKRVGAWDEVLVDRDKVERRKISVEGLVKDLGLSSEARRFWLQRVKRWEQGIKGDEDDRSDNEEPPKDDYYSDDADEEGEEPLS